MNNPVSLHAIVVVAAAMTLLFAAVHDVACRTIPNSAPMMVATAGLGLNLLAGEVVTAVAVAMFVFYSGWVLWRNNWMGGGDVKLLGASALVVPPESVPILILNTAIAGGVLAVIYLTLSHLAPGKPGPRPSGFFMRVLRAERHRIRRGPTLPYGCAIAAGALTTLVSRIGFG